MRTASIAAILLAASVPGVASAQTTPDGAKIFTRCAACHTATGSGVPGAYPPLQSDFRTLAAKAPGRRYLALAVIKGLSGPVTVEGKPYRGFMPAQTLDDASVAAVLNHVGTMVAKSGPAFKAFTAAEVAASRSDGTGLSAADIAKLRASSGGQ